jgi:hypothetical protein
VYSGQKERASKMEMQNTNLKSNKNVNRAISISFVLLLSFSMLLMIAPTASAHDPPWTIVSYAYLSVAPNPIGAGQTASVCMWVDTPLPSGA